jgi:glycosyltransferase involved in cell wall biosynthesis
MTVRTPRVTVGIPFFDEERYLADAVRSVLVQSVRDIEVLLVDDGSTDASLSVARAFDDPRVKVHSDGKRRRLPARLNEIVRLARAPLVARMDADDVSHPERLALQLAAMGGESGCDAVGTWAALVDERAEPFAVVEGTPLPATQAAALERSVLVHPTMLARRSWLLANPYDESLTRAEDRDLWIRTAATSTIRVVPECRYVIRVTPGDARFVADYVAAQRENRRLYLRYGARSIGLARTAQLLFASHAKSLVTRAAVRAGFGGALVRRRGRAPTERECVLAREALAAGAK